MDKGHRTRERREPVRRIQDTLIRSIMIMITILVFVFGGLQIHFYRSETEEDFEEKASSYCKIAAQLSMRADITRYASTLTKDDDWYLVKERLHFLWSAGKSKYVYIVIPQETGYLYIWDVGGGEGVCDLGDFDEYYSGGDVVMKEAFRLPQGECRTMISRHPVYGYVVSVFTPVYNLDNEPVALACVDLDAEEINDDIARFLRVSIGFLVLLVIFSALGFYLQTNTLIVKPIKKLERLAAGYVKNQMTEGIILDPDIHTGDEIEALANALSSMSAQMCVYIADLQKAIKQKETVRAELDVSRRVQESMLPRKFPAFPELPQVDLYASMDAAREVGGDFYDFFRIDDDRIGFCVADVSGKGIPAAMFMTYAKTLLRIQSQNEEDPGDVFTTVNRILCEHNEEDMFVTAFLAVVNMKSMVMTYVNAGHCPPLFRHAGENYSYMKVRSGFILAGMDTVRYRSEQTDLLPGDELFLYTDGVTEATNEQKELFGEERLRNLANEGIGLTSKELTEKILEGITEFVGVAPQFDDITMLSFRLLSETGNTEETNEKI